MDEVAIPNSLFALEDRNKLAAAVIKKFATRHAWTDVIMGLIATAIQVPGAGVAATAAGVAIQAKVFYQPMVRELAEIYSASPDDVIKGIVGVTTGVEIVTDTLVNEFGNEFIQEIFVEIVQELGLSTGLAWIPLFGGAISAAVDAKVAKALTWTVGVMTAVYFLNGGHFMGSRKETYVLCKQLAAELVQGSDGNNLNHVLSKVPGLVPSMVIQLARFIIVVLRGVKGVIQAILSRLGLAHLKPLDANEIRSALEAKRVPVWLVDEVIQYAAGKPLAQVA